MSRPVPQMDLLTTKLHPPPVREKQVVRARLLERLDAAIQQRLTLVCAPAGYGKTTLLSQWVYRRGSPVGWVSLDPSDNDLAQFLRYLLAAIQCVDPAVGEQVGEAPPAPQPPPGPAVWLPLVNDVAASDREFVIILDDYQEVEDRGVHGALDYLIEHMPDNMHLILATRADPPLSLPRLRARGHLTEVRLSDLRFNAQEAAEFLNTVMGLNLTAGGVTALETKTEGWIASLQMAALSLQGGRADATSRSEFIREFTGSHRFILDYLVEEVLKRQPAELQEFLLKTSILKRLCGGLCEAVTDRTDGQNVLERLDAASLFIIPLDEERRWYRYHRLFSDLLRKRLSQTFPGLAPALHLRAGRWYEQHGLTPEAIEHTLAGRDYERAADLIEESAEATLMRSELETLLKWVNRLPEESLHSRPTLCFYYTWASVMSGRSLATIERLLQIVTSAQEDASMPGRIAALRGYMLLLQADIEGAARLCRQALEDLPDSDHFLRGIVAWILSLLQLDAAGLQEGKQALKEVVRMSEEAGNPLLAVTALSHVARLQVRQGRLPQAKQTLEQALKMASDSQGRRLPIASEALIWLGDLAREWNDLELAAEYLYESIELAQHWSELSAFDAYFPLMRVHLAQRDLEQAQATLETAKQIAYGSDITQLDDILADLQEAYYFSRLGDTETVMRWAEKRNLLPGGSPEPYPIPNEPQDYITAHLRKYEQLVLAHVLIQLERTDEALALLEGLLGHARGLRRTDFLIETQILKALALQQGDRMGDALEALAEALTLAEPGGYVRIFIDEGEAIGGLLRLAASHGISPSYVSTLLTALGESELAQPFEQPTHPQPLAEPLSERELEVLHLLAAGMSNPEIAEELVIAVSTVHSHCKSIYSKLDVHSRFGAVQGARELGLI